MRTIHVEYIWVSGDGSPDVKSKSRMLSLPDSLFDSEEGFELSNKDIPIWSFEGFDSNHDSDGELILVPCFLANNPLKANSLIVLCEVFNEDLKPAKSSHRHELSLLYKEALNDGLDPMISISFRQQYLSKPSHATLLPDDHLNGYCSNGIDKVLGRALAEKHLNACIMAGLSISELSPLSAFGQWQFGIGGSGMSSITACDHLIVARFLLYRLAEIEGLRVDLSHFPQVAETEIKSNLVVILSTGLTREEGGLQSVKELCKKLCTKTVAKRHALSYGRDYFNEVYSEADKPSWGPTSEKNLIRMPWSTIRSNKGGLEDHRPGSDANPYQVLASFVKTTVEIRKKHKKTEE